MQKRPNNNKFWLIFFKIIEKLFEKSKNVFAKIAIKKKIINFGKFIFFSSPLKNQLESNSRGIIHKVLPNFNVAATCADSSLYNKAVPITELVSCMANADHAPN